jgi:hypothetical protein
MAARSPRARESPPGGGEQRPVFKRLPLEANVEEQFVVVEIGFRDIAQFAHDDEHVCQPIFSRNASNPFVFAAFAPVVTAVGIKARPAKRAGDLERQKQIMPIVHKAALD